MTLNACQSLNQNYSIIVPLRKYVEPSPVISSFYNVLGKLTSCADMYLMDIIFDLCIGRIRSHADEVEREVFCRRQQAFDWHAAVIAAARFVGQIDGSVPTVEVEQLFQGVGNTGPGAADSYDCVVGLGIIQVDVATPFWKERYVPIGRHEPYRVARCTEPT